MKPGASYKAAPVHMRHREEAVCGELQVVTESYPSEVAATDKCVVQLSTDSGRTYQELEWSVSLLGRLSLLPSGRDWPPQNGGLSIKKFDETGLVVSYLEHLDASNAKVFTIVYSFETRKWSV